MIPSGNRSILLQPNAQGLQVVVTGDNFDGFTVP